MFEGGKSSKSKFKNKNRKFGNKNGPKQGQAGNGKRVKTDKSRDACHYCGKQGHWKMNRFQFFASLKKDKPLDGTSTILIIETNLLVNSVGSWCIDSGATFYVYNTLPGF